MSKKTAISPENRELVRSARERGESIRAIARRVGVSPGAVRTALAKIVDRTRKADEFRNTAIAIEAPRRDTGPYTWDLESIRGARDSQMRGDFKQAVRLAEAMRTDDALFVAYHNRIAPQSAVQAKLVPHDSARGAQTANRAARSIITPREVLEGIHGTLANHGIAIGFIVREVSDDGTRVDMRLTEWPLEHVKWNASTEQLETAVRGLGQRVVITHGDGTWIVFRKFYDRPWVQEACILPGALLWAAHGNGVSDWASATRAHGLAKIVGELPAGVALQADGESLTPEARTFLAMIQAMVSGESGAGLRPAGSKLDFLNNGSTAWQVFAELINNREKSAARIYLGTDAILGSVGGAPGVDIATLFGVATTKVQGDFEAIEQGLRTGLYEPWTAINDGDSRYSPSLKYQMPDPDSAKKAAEYGERQTAFFAAVKQHKDLGLRLDQAVLDELAERYGVTAPTLITAPGTPPPAGAAV